MKVNNGNIVEWLEESELCGQSELPSNPSYVIY